MKFLIFSLLVFGVFPLALIAEEKAHIDTSILKHPIKAALWKIEGKGLEQPSYLFGTAHVADPRITTLNPKAEAAFQASTHVYTEIDLDPTAQLKIMPKLMRSDGKTLNESIGSELSNALKACVTKIEPSLSTAQFQPLKTWVIATIVPDLESRMKNANKEALDVYLYRRATDSNKNVGALETAESQLKIFDDLQEAEQIQYLKATLELMNKNEDKAVNSTTELIDIYLTQDIVSIGKYVENQMNQVEIEHKELSDKLMKRLLEDRNITMTEVIEKQLTEIPSGSHFFAVGAAHYTGTTAIQTLLEKKGYTITPTF